MMNLHLRLSSGVCALDSTAARAQPLILLFFIPVVRARVCDGNHGFVFTDAMELFPRIPFSAAPELLGNGSSGEMVLETAINDRADAIITFSATRSA